MKIINCAFTPWPFLSERDAFSIFLEKVFALSRYLCYITLMARGESGRIVIEVESQMKKRLYAALALSGSTMKDWFCKKAVDYCHDAVEPSFFDKLEPLPQSRTAVPAKTATATKGTNETPGV